MQLTVKTEQPKTLNNAESNGFIRNEWEIKVVVAIHWIRRLCKYYITSVFQQEYIIRHT